MDIIVTTIKQIGRKIELDGDTMIGYQHSAKLYIKLIKDTSDTNPFKDMILSGYCTSWKSDKSIPCPIVEKDGSTYILLDGKVFENSGRVYLSLGAIDDKKVVITSNMLEMQVEESNSINVFVTEPEKYWQIEVLNAMKVWYAQSVDAPLKEILAQLDEMIATAKSQQTIVTNLTNTAKTQQTEVATAIRNSNSATENAKSATTQANTAAQSAMNASSEANTKIIQMEHQIAESTTVTKGANDAAKSANDAATNANAKATLANTSATTANEKANLANTAAGVANTAAANANEKANLANIVKEAMDALIAEVQRKLDAGEFIGATGPVSTVDGQLVEGIATKKDIYVTGWGDDLWNRMFSGNLNSLAGTPSKVLYYRPGTTNYPGDLVEGYLINLNYSSKSYFTKQIAFDINVGSRNVMWVRTCVNSKWTSWVKMASTEDLNKYMPLTGGTLTGDILLDGATLRAKKADGSQRDVFYVDENLVAIGTSDRNLELKGAVMAGGNITLNNTYSIFGKDNTDTAYRMLYMSNSGNTVVGNESKSMQLLAPLKPHWSNGTATKELATVEDINNKFATVTNFTGSDPTYTAQFPSGFTQTNCVILSAMANDGNSAIYTNGAGRIMSNSMQAYCNPYFNNNVIKMESYLYQVTGVAPTFKVVLMKV